MTRNEARAVLVTMRKNATASAELTREFAAQNQKRVDSIPETDTQARRYWQRFADEGIATAAKWTKEAAALAVALDALKEGV